MISIVIIVKNEIAIDKTLENLTSVSKPCKTEILVVDASEGKLDALKHKYSNVKWIKFAPKEHKRTTIPEQRNIGVKNAMGSIVVFIDANCIAKKEWLYNLTRPLIEENEFMAFGRTLSLNGSSIHDQDYAYNDKKYIDESSTINLAIKKSVFDDVGYFDETFGYGSDIDFTWRCVDKGYKIRYIKNAIIFHDWGNTKREIKRFFQYGAARAHLYKKHKKLVKLIKNDYYILIYSTILLLVPFMFFIPYLCLIFLILFIKNIKNNPFIVIGNHLIYALGFLSELPKRYI